MNVIHPVETCAGCAADDDLRLFHFARDDGVNIRFFHGCSHRAFAGWWQGAPSMEWLASLDVTRCGWDCTTGDP